MNDTTIAVGGVLLVGVVAGATWYATSKANKPGGVAPARPVTPSTGPILTTMPVPNNPSGLYAPGATQPAPFQDPNGQALALELAAQRAENARREAEAKEAERQSKIDALRNTIAAVENAQVLNLTRLQSIENDQSGLSGMIDLARKEGYASCDRKGWDVFGACHAEVDASSINPDVPYSGVNKWKAEVKRRLIPEQSNLARLEEQFIGLKYDLKQKFGVDYVPSPVSRAAHEYAAAHPGR